MPRLRGRGRGRGGYSRGRGASRVGNSTVSGSRRVTKSFLNHTAGREKFIARRHGNSPVYATWEAPWLTVSGLRREQFSDHDSENGEDDDSQSQNSSGAYSQDPEYLEKPIRKQLLAAQEGENGDDWTEIEEEAIVDPPRRGFYRPPPTRQVVVKRVRRSELGEEIDGNQARSSSLPASSQKRELPKRSRRTNSARGTRSFDGDDITEANESPEPQHFQSRIEEADDLPQLAEEEEDEEEEELPPEIIDEGDLSDTEFPPPFLERPSTPNDADCEDAADFILKTRFAPMSDPQAFVKALTKYPPAQRDSKVLYALALNAQEALKEWQDEYLILDLRTAPSANPPKKPLTGGRVPVETQIWEDMKEAGLYNYAYDPKKAPGTQNPFAQRIGGSDSNGGRALRQRRARDVGGDASEDDGAGSEGGKRRRRKAVQRYDGVPAEATRGRKRMLDSGTPDYDGPPKKRGRPSAAEKAFMHQKVRQLREESAITTTSDGDNGSPERRKRRGRPPGSKNTGPRSDAGVKKGPRKMKGTSTLGSSGTQSMTGQYLDPRTALRSPGAPASSVDEEMVEHEHIEQSVETYVPPEPSLRPNSMDRLQPYIKDAMSVSTPSTPDGQPDKKKRIKSEKRSQSMTIWWAARKQRDAETRREQMAQQAAGNRLMEQQQQSQAPPPGPAQLAQPIQPAQQLQSPYPALEHQRFYNNGPPAPPPLQQQQQSHQVHQAPGPEQRTYHGPPDYGRGPPPPPPSNSYHQHASQPPGNPYSQQPNQPPPGTQYPQQPAPPPPGSHYPQHVAQSLPPLQMQNYVTPLQARPPSQHAKKRSSPLKKIINYVSDPSKAAQPSHGPFQTIMAPGAGSPTTPSQPQYNSPVIQARPRTADRPPHQPYQMLMVSDSGQPIMVVPASQNSQFSQPILQPQPPPPPPPPSHVPQSPQHGQPPNPQQPPSNSHQQSSQPQTPTQASQSLPHPIHPSQPSHSKSNSGYGSFMIRTPTNEQSRSNYPPGGASNRPGSVPPAPNVQQVPSPAPGRQLAPLAPSGKMTGAQVQDLHLAQVQPVQRRPIEFVLQQQKQQQQGAQHHNGRPQQSQPHPIQPHPSGSHPGQPGQQGSPIFQQYQPSPSLHSHGPPQQQQQLQGPPHSQPQQYLPALAPAPPSHSNNHGPQSHASPSSHQPPGPTLLPAFGQSQNQGPGQPIAPAPPPPFGASQQHMGSQPSPVQQHQQQGPIQQQSQGPGQPQQQMRFVEMHGDGRRGSRSK